MFSTSIVLTLRADKYRSILKKDGGGETTKMLNIKELVEKDLFSKNI
jgi:hypothetical protein